jgi:hypothetical protein
MLQIQRDISPDISDQIPPEHMSEEVNKTGKSSVATVKTAECPQSGSLFKRFEHKIC